MSSNPITNIVNAMETALMDAVQAAAAAPLNPVTLALAVAAGLVMGLLFMQLLSDIAAIGNRCAQEVEVWVVRRIRWQSRVLRLLLSRKDGGNTAAVGTSVPSSQ